LKNLKKKFQVDFRKLGWAERVTFSISIIYICLLIINILTFGLSAISVMNLFANNKPCDGSSCEDFCDETDPTMCILPFPSSRFLIEDSTTSSGFRVNFGEKSLPITRDYGRMKPTYLNELDGFSTIGPCLFYLEDANMEGVIPYTNISIYMNSDVKTVFIEVPTGRRIPHWVELDAVDPKKPVIIIQPAIPLEFKTRYVVGVRNIINNQGDVIEPTAGFKKYSEETHNDDERWVYYQQKIFPVLETDGFSKSELQLAWDFVTISREWSLSRAEWMRDDSLSKIDSITYSVDKIEDLDCSDENIGRRIWGHMIVPSYKQSSARYSLLTRDDPNNPMGVRANGVMEHQFLLQIPCSVMENPKPSMLVQYGHGLLGDRSESMSGWISEMANRFGWILVGMDWYGMAKFDIPLLAKILMSNPTDFAVLTENSIQGFVNNAVSLRVLITRFVNDSSVKVGEISVIDPNQVYYYGNSQGAILGGGYVALSTDFHRAVMGVPGTPYALLLSRSVDFETYHLLFNTEMRSWREIRLSICLMQMLWDPAETAGWLYSMKRSPGPGNHPKEILLHDALGDAQVTNLGAQIMARAVNASSVFPQTREIYGVNELTAPFYGSAIVEFKYDDVPPEPTTNTSPSRETDTHECPRRQIEAQNQIRDFFESGIINQYCIGKCERPTCSDL